MFETMNKPAAGRLACAYPESLQVRWCPQVRHQSTNPIFDPTGGAFVLTHS